jgi:hypothetical protein
VRSDHQVHRFSPAIVLCGLLVLAAGLRLFAARGDLWLDELWSLSFARQMRSPLDVWTAIHHDNNHPLNTLYLFVVVHLAGAHASPLLFRLLSLMSGAAMLVVLFRSEYESHDVAAATRALIATTLCACSFLAILYSSEARGYAPAALCGVLAYAQVRRGRILRSGDRLLFAATCAAGLLSHLTFLFVYAGLFAWTALTAARNAGFGWRAWMALHRFPIAFILAEYVLDARHLAYGGGPAFSMSEVLRRALSVALGGPDAGMWGLVSAAYAVCLIAVGLQLLRRERPDEAIFFVTALVLAPAAILSVYHARFLEVRYFFVLLPFVWLLAARTLAYARASGPAGRVIVPIMLTASIIGNGVHVVTMLREGRGHYARAVATMSALTSAQDIVVGSDQDFSNRLILDYYAEEIAQDRRLTYVSASAEGGRVPQWFITHTFDTPAAMPPTLVTTAHGETYTWVQSFPYGGLSGCNWFLYQRQVRPPV